MPEPKVSRFREWAQRHERWWPLVFFLAGFVYDVFSLSRIDSFWSIVQQAVYLAGIALGLSLEILGTSARLQASPRWSKIWQYHEHAIHFLLGSLLSQYTLFFFKSSSIRTSFFFMAVLLGLLVVNEFKRFQGNSGIPVRSGLFSLCLISFLICLVPVVLGTVGPLPFLLALALSIGCTYLLAQALRKRLGAQASCLRKQLCNPFIAVTSTFAVLYFARVIPPVPLAVNYIGIFHDVKKENGKYVLTSTRPFWKFWQNGDQTFLSRAGDRLYSFIRIFSPGRFQGEVQVRWLFYDPKRGWQGTDAIPLAITGGRDEGYRGFIYKANYQPGDWQVRVETKDEREIGRIYFTVENDDSTDLREYRQESQ